MPQLIAPLPDFLTLNQDAVHGADRAVVDTLVEQAGGGSGGGFVGGSGGLPDWRWRRQTHALTIDAGARHDQSRARTGGETSRRRQRDDGVNHDASSLSDVASGRPNKAATFFWMAMMASACSSLRKSRAFSRLACASSPAIGLRTAGLGPRLIDVIAPSAPASRSRRHSLKVDEYRPSRRRIAPVPPAGARSISARTRSLSCTVNVRRRGRS